jgi:hypothetical protein
LRCGSCAAAAQGARRARGRNERGLPLSPRLVKAWAPRLPSAAKPSPCLQLRRPSAHPPHPTPLPPAPGMGAVQSIRPCPPPCPQLHRSAGAAAALDVHVRMRLAVQVRGPWPRGRLSPLPRPHACLSRLPPPWGRAFGLAEGSSGRAAQCPPQPRTRAQRSAAVPRALARPRPSLPTTAARRMNKPRTKGLARPPHPQPLAPNPPDPIPPGPA